MITPRTLDRMQHLTRILAPAVVHKRVSLRWDVSGRFPMPKRDLSCPYCGSGEVIYSQCYFHARQGSPPPTIYRADVQCKCTDCSMVFVFGVVIPDRMFHANVPPEDTWKQYSRREIRQILGFDEETRETSR